MRIQSLICITVHREKNIRLKILKEISAFYVKPFGFLHRYLNFMPRDILDSKEILKTNQKICNVDFE